MWSVQPDDLHTITPALRFTAQFEPPFLWTFVIIVTGLEANASARHPAPHQRRTTCRPMKTKEEIGFHSVGPLARSVTGFFFPSSRTRGRRGFRGQPDHKAHGPELERGLRCRLPWRSALLCPVGSRTTKPPVLGLASRDCIVSVRFLIAGIRQCAGVVRGFEVIVSFCGEACCRPRIPAPSLALAAARVSVCRSPLVLYALRSHPRFSHPP